MKSTKYEIGNYEKHEARNKISELKFEVSKVPKIEIVTLAHFRHFSSL